MWWQRWNPILYNGIFNSCCSSRTYVVIMAYSMGHSPSREANQFSASQEIPRILWKPKIHCRIHKYPPPVRIQRISPVPRSLWVVRNMIRFYGEELLAPRPTPKLEDHPSSAVCDCLFNTFAATLHIGGRSSVLKLRTRHAVVTGTHLWGTYVVISLKYLP